MTVAAHTFIDLLREVLYKSSFFSEKEVADLLALVAALIGSPVVSVRKVAKRSGGRFTSNFLTDCLKKYAYVQRRVAAIAFGMVQDWPSFRDKVFLLLDDTLIKKRGKTIFGAVKWFDHTLGRCIQALCVVNGAVVVRGRVIFLLPWLLGTPHRPPSGSRTRGKEQDQKTQLGIALIKEFIALFQAHGVQNKQIVVLADAWFSNQTMMSFLKEAQLNYRIDARKNYRVQVPDKEAQKKAQTAKKGRKKRTFVKWVPLEEYLGNPAQWASFTDPETEERVYYHTATVTLKSAGKVRVYAYQRETSTTTKYLLTPARRTRPPTPQTVYHDYRIRWRIEEAHKDLKQHFGLTKNQQRDAWAVQGFLGLVYVSYSLWKGASLQDETRTHETVSCHEWAEEFYREQIRYEEVWKA